jgi:L,D-transpeptidase catalytic domain
MNFYFVDPNSIRVLWHVARLGVASLAALIAANDVTGAASVQNQQSMELRSAGEPIMAIVSLREQQITVYDANGWIMRAPVSSAQKGRETPAGVFSILQKEAEHYSNMYDDAYMPNMQRLTWSGIALHGGALPGYPASHGCIRMPYDFAERLFDVTRLGMRVIVAPTDVAPVAIDHPALFQPKTGPDVVAASAAAAEANEAASKAEQARLAAVIASREAARVMVAIRTAEFLKDKAEEQLAKAKERPEDIRAKAAAAQVDRLEAQLASAKAELQPKLDAATAARQSAVTAEAARVVAAETARKMARDFDPVSVFISRKTQHLYVRQAFQPILDIPVTIQDVDRPIGTHIFTALARTDAGKDLRWSVVSLLDRHTDSSRDKPHASARERQGREIETIPADPVSAKAALDRIAIPQDTIDRIAEMVGPRSSLIISDEALSPETGDGTEFVVLMSGEPQGGLKHRRRDPQIGVRYDSSPYWRSPNTGPYSASPSRF